MCIKIYLYIFLCCQSEKSSFNPITTLTTCNKCGFKQSHGKKEKIESIFQTWLR